VINILISLDDNKKDGRKKNPEISLVFTDLDGTLSHNGLISADNVSAIRDFLGYNFMNHVVLASARPEYSLKRVLEEHDLAGLLEEHISLCTFNGQLSYHNGFKLTDIPIPQDVVSGIAGKLSGADELVMFHSANTSYGNISAAWKAWEKENLHYEFNRLPKDFDKTSVYLIEIINTVRKDLSSIITALDHRDDISTYSFPTVFTGELPEAITRLAHIIPASVNKGTALGKYIEASGVDPENVLVLGDNINDYDALIYPGVNAVLIGKPEETLRRKFDESSSRIYVTENPETGFAYALERFR